ncbi:MAG: hypothetical protein NC126_07740 [Clostridium sp.]|nr:hypothetical protein [Clostridium sp.]
MGKRGAYVGVSEFFRTQDENFKDLATLGKEFNYRQDIILILKGEEEELKKQFPETYRTIETCRHHSDKRTLFEYAQDVAASWLFEDFIIARAKALAEQTNEPFTLVLSGADRKRQFLPTTKVSASADCQFTYRGVTIPVEITTDYGLYWEREQKIDLRDDKFEKMRAEQAILIGVSTQDSKYIIIDFAKKPTAEKEFHFQWKKDAYTIHFRENAIALKPFTMDDVMQELMEAAKKKSE